MNLLGCTAKHFKDYFEKKFTEGMSWEIFMSGGQIHIDHIQPCSSFDLSEPAQQQACFHYSNLQPLWAKDNLRKSDFYVPKETEADIVNTGPCSGPIQVAPPLIEAPVGPS